LEQPPVAPKTKDWPNWFGTDFSSTLQRLRDWQKETGRELRSIYSQYHQKRLEEILRFCAEWGVQLLVLPEYSVPPECLSALLAYTRNMTVVFGTHTVEGRLLDAGEYSRFGCPQPAPRTAVAPVAVDGVLRAFQPKLTQNWLETGLILGTAWDAIELEQHQTALGVFICLDFIHRDGTAHRNHVAEKLKRCGLLAVPSLTPYHTVPEFDARAQMDAIRYGHPVLYADSAEGGGTSIYVDSVLEKQNGFFPFSIPSLGRGEEGIVIADIDVAMTEVAGKVSRRFQERDAAIPVAASVFNTAR